MTWWGRLFRRGRLERDLDRELGDHIERQVAEYVARGMSEKAARRRTALAFGGLDRVKEDCRDARGTRWLEDAVQDIRYSCRVLAASRGFTVVAVLSLALGIGANTAIFSLVNSLLIRTLPVREPQRLVMMGEQSWTNPIWEQVRERRRQIFDGAFAWSYERFDLGKGGEAETVQGLWASGGMFDVLGVPAVLGRTLTPEDDRRGGAGGFVTVISYRFWQHRYGGAADVLGRTIDLNRVPFTIVGVAPPDFFGPATGNTFDVVVPVAAAALFTTGPESRLDGRSTWWLNVMARLKPSQTLAQAAAALHRTQPAIRDATMPTLGWPGYLETYLRDPITLVPAAGGFSSLRQRYHRPLLIVMVVVGLVLLIACANLANLLLARAESRRHELAMRRALGASRLRLARQLLTESLLLAAAGAALGLLVAHWCSRLLVAQLSTPEDAVFLDLSLDWRVLLFTSGVALVTAVLFGIAPALIAGRVDAAEALKEQGRGPADAGRRRVGQPLVAVQVALSLVLVVAAGLFVRSFVALATLDLGFERDQVLIVNVDALRSRVAAADRPALFERARQAVAALPRVSHAAVSLITPVSGRGWNNVFEFPELTHLSRRDRMAFLNAVSPDWFRTYGTSLLAGRDFDAGDRAGSPRVAIVNETFVRKFLRTRHPVGLPIRQMSIADGEPQAPMEIVGVVEDAAYRSVRDPVPPTVYLPMAQAEAGDLPPATSVSVRAAHGSPELLIKSIAAALARVDPDFSLTFVPLADQVNASVARERLLAMLSGFFGALALLLAGVGIYGVTAYAVTLRRTEIGIRMALGATGRSVLRLVIGRIGVLLLAGIAAGLLASVWAARFVGSLLFDTGPRDPATIAAAALVLAAIGTLAAWLPARRASRIDPAEVLRQG